MVCSPNKNSTKLKLNIPTNPQFRHPIIHNVKAILYNVFIFILLNLTITIVDNIIVIIHIFLNILYNLLEWGWIMKKIFLISMFLLLLTGCGLTNSEDVLKGLSNNINKANSYYLEGTMEIMNNEDTYSYAVKVSYKKDNYYKVELTNISNDHEQIILRNDDGVYVITPNLNKSFKFQSDWPNNNSQVYLLNSIVEDLSNDKEYTSVKNDKGYVLTSKVNYPNNANLIKQSVYIDKNLKITKVEILDNNEKVQIKMDFATIDMGKKFKDNYFDLDQIVKVKDNSSKKDNSNINSTDDNSSTKKDDDTANNNTGNNSNSEDESSNTNNNSNVNNNDNTNNNSNVNNNNNNTNNSSSDNNTNSTNDANNNSQSEKKTKKTATINDVVYPMYLPSNTYLTTKETIDIDNGQRLIMNFDGDKSFVLIEETTNTNDDNIIIPVVGEIEFVSDVLAVVSDKSLTWSSSGIDYYLASADLEVSELLQIANSISYLPVSK